MDNVDVYNNDHGWRISFPIGNGIQVLTLDETKELEEVLKSAIIYAESASQQAVEADAKCGCIDRYRLKCPSLIGDNECKLKHTA